MTDRNPSSSPNPKSTQASPNHPPTTTDSNTFTVSPWRCFSGAFVSGSLALVIYQMVNAIATTYANKPIPSTNITAINIAAAVRTLVVGIVALGAGVFGFAALGLFALGIQTTIQRLRSSKSSSFS